MAIRLLDDVGLLDVDAEVIAIASVYVKQKMMPGPVHGDAIHLAVASLRGIEYLMTWNIRHVANPNKLTHISVINRCLGLVTPEIVIPESLWVER